MAKAERSSTSNLSLLYEGDAVPSSMTARELAGIIQALDSLAKKAAGVLHGRDVRTELRISSIRESSIDLNGFIELVAIGQSAFGGFPFLSFGVENAPELIKRWLDLLKFLKSSPGSSITNNGDGSVSIINNDGEVKIENLNIYNTLLSTNAGEKAARLATPFAQGANSLHLISAGKKIATYSKADAKEFRRISIPAQFSAVVDAILEIRSPVFGKSGTWKFNYGNQGITATIEDSAFLSNVNSGSEAFRKGDKFVTRMRLDQIFESGKSKLKYTIVEVVRRL